MHYSLQLRDLTVGISLPPNEDGIPYTIPTIQLSNGEWIMNSRKIAARLEQLYHEPTLNMNSAYLTEIEALTEKITQVVPPDFIPRIPKNLLGEGSIDYWYRTREEWFEGKRLDEVAIEKGGDQVYAAARPDVERVTALLERDPSGPFFEGRMVTYADFIWASFLRFFENLEVECLHKLIGPNGQSHIALLKACRLWSERAGH